MTDPLLCPTCHHPIEAHHPTEYGEDVCVALGYKKPYGGVCPCKGSEMTCESHYTPEDWDTLKEQHFCSACARCMIDGCDGGYTLHTATCPKTYCRNCQEPEEDCTCGNYEDGDANDYCTYCASLLVLGEHENGCPRRRHLTERDIEQARRNYPREKLRIDFVGKAPPYDLGCRGCWGIIRGGQDAVDAAVGAFHRDCFDTIYPGYLKA